jgi:predicted ATP-grasp superfamily ATP-dependent carboligase
MVEKIDQNYIQMGKISNFNALVWSKGQIWKKNDLNRPKKARRIDNKSKFCFKLPRIEMEMSEVGKNCEKSLKIAQNKPVKR